MANSPGANNGFHCRRCNSSRLGKLNKRASKDNDVFRCLECGHIFSPALELDHEKVDKRSRKGP